MLNLPNLITLSRIVLVVIFTIAVSITHEYSWGYTIALTSFLLAAVSDWLDGYLARKLKQVTTFGKLIDPLADKITISAACIFLTYAKYCPAWAAIVIIGREFLVTGIRQIAQEQNIIIAADMTGKCKMVFQIAFCTAGLLLLTVNQAGSSAPGWLQTLASWCRPGDGILYHITFWGTLLLTVWSGLSYSIGARHLFTRK